MDRLNNTDRIMIVESIESYILELRKDQATWGTNEDDKDMGMFFDIKIQAYKNLIEKIKK
jgi:hypothetical protein